jgi:hypothetical protein
VILPLAFALIGFLFGIAVGVALTMDTSEDDSDGQ